MLRALTIEDSKRKSSRSKADLFEVLVAIGLGRHYNLDIRSLEKEKDRLEDKIYEFKNGDRRTEEQYRRARILIPLLVKKLDKEIVSMYGKPSVVRWIGRRWQTENTLADIELIFKPKKASVGISLKSTRQGQGTQKNLGYKTLNKLLGLNLTSELDEMWSKIREDLKKRGSELSEISQRSQRDIKDAKYKYPVIQEIGKRYGLPVQKLAVERSVMLFNKLSEKNRLKFLEEIFGIGSTNPLLNVLVTGETVKLHWDEISRDLAKGNIFAEKLGDKSYHIIVDGKPIVRLQASFTNGIGLSAFCERAFII